MFTTPAAEARFWSKVDRTPTCWLWTAAVGRRGFGVASDPRHAGGSGTLAHRVAWEAANGTALPPGTALLHRCGTKTCVRPDHLELVSGRARGWRAGGRHWAAEGPEILARIAAWKPTAGAIPLPVAAELLGMHPYTLRRAIVAGELPAPPARSRRIRILQREDLVAGVRGRPGGGGCGGLTHRPCRWPRLP